MLFSKPKYDYIIVGLGNPGDKYSETRHNVGFRCVDLLIKELNAGPEKNKFQSLIYDAEIKGHKVLLQKPLTFMNNSGAAVTEAATSLSTQDGFVSENRAVTAVTTDCVT